MLHTTSFPRCRSEQLLEESHKEHNGTRSHLGKRGPRHPLFSPLQAPRIEDIPFTSLIARAPAFFFFFVVHTR